MEETSLPSQFYRWQTGTDFEKLTWDDAPVQHFIGCPRFTYRRARACSSLSDGLCVRRCISVTHPIWAADGKIAGCIVLTDGLIPAHELEHGCSSDSRNLNLNLTPAHSRTNILHIAMDSTTRCMDREVYLKSGGKEFSQTYQKVHSFTNAQDETNTFKGIREINKGSCHGKLWTPWVFHCVRRQSFFFISKIHWENMYLCVYICMYKHKSSEHSWR